MTTMPPAVVGGVDTHLDVHVAAALDSTGGLLGVESFPTTTNGYLEVPRFHGRGGCGVIMPRERRVC